MFTKQNLPSILTLALLVLTIGILFWHGDQTIQKANDVKSTIIAWENLKTPVADDQNLDFFIQNLEDKTNSYQVTFLVNEEAVDSQKIEIKSKHKEIILPKKKALAKLAELSKTNLSSGQPGILYQVKISWGSTPKADQQAGKHKTETLGKWLKIK